MPVMPKAKTKITKQDRISNLRAAAYKAIATKTENTKSYFFPIQTPNIPQGVVPKDITAPVMAMDATSFTQYTGMSSMSFGGGFPGYQYLAMLTTRSEFRAMASSIANEITRKWIKFHSQQNDDVDNAEKIKQIEAEFDRLNVQSMIQRAAEDDCYFGRAQIFLNIRGAERESPLILSPKTIEKGSFLSAVNIEAIWTTPSEYNTSDPAAADFYKPSSWFMLGQQVHSSRLLTVVTRELPDMLKPAFNFSGMSLSQLAEPYVDNWLRTRQSVSDLINNFSITALATSMDQVLQGEDDGTGLFARADLFTATRSNKGLMLLDKEREELLQINTPLSGLHELQAQSQEHMASTARIPSVILTGISPSGLNASSEGEIRIFYDWIASQQEAFWREPITLILRCVQLSLFGEIDDDIGFDFVPLYQMTDKEQAEIREINSRVDVAYSTNGVIDPSEIRQRLANDDSSGYNGIDVDAEIGEPMPDMDVTEQATPDEKAD